ncbi:zf-TFIIB domain-containing protein [Primorskyibacter sp. S187A]|uniref:TFIIB-type zinc ribbon-containing protein n=1 Tax=Primorskyibacter sp. S187A TaxID=3415130 RepID=UPI003C79D213
MPLMSSPIDGAPMREVERYGVKLDICPTSGGIWLDKGELEKIIMMIREEAMQDAGMPPPPPSGRVSGGYQSQSRAAHGTYAPQGHPPRKKKRDGLFDSLMDIFD